MGYTNTDPMPVAVIGAGSGPVPVSEGGGLYEIVAANDSGQDIGPATPGDVLVSIRIRPTDSALASDVIIKDGATEIDRFTQAQVDAGERYRYYGMRAVTKWVVVTPTDGSVIAVYKPASET